MVHLPRILFVLGMHRSGTSALTRALATLGAHIGTNLMPANEYNPHGYFEDLDFVRINNRLLEALGRNWHEMLQINKDRLEDVMRSPYAEEAGGFLRRHIADHPLTVLKDPRLCLLAPFWRSVCDKAGIDYSFVIAIRDPRAVARSLFVREMIPPAKSGWAWLDYTISALQGTANKKRMFVDYDHLLDQPASELDRIVAFIHGPARRQLSGLLANELIDQSMNHGWDYGEPPPGFDPAGIPGLALKLHALLLPAARAYGDLERMMPAVDEVADEFNSMAGIGLMYTELERKVKKLNALMNQVAVDHAAKLKIQEETLQGNIDAHYLWAKQLEVKVGEEQQTIQQVRSEKECLAKRVESMENSLSWRLTKGLRWLANRSGIIIAPDKPAP